MMLITSDSYAIIKTFDSYVKPAIIKAMDSYVKPAIVKAMDSYVKPAFKKAMVSYVKPAIKETLDSYIKPAIKNVFDWSKNIINNYFWGKPVPEELEFKESKSALKKFTMQYRIEGKDGYDPTSFLNFVKLKATNLLRNNRGTKVKMILRCNMEKTNIATGDTITDPAAFHSKVEVNLKSTDVNDLYNKKVDNVLESLATFQTRGSNWVFRSIINLDIHTVAYEPLKGNSYIPLPTELEMKKAIINMKNNDDECFKCIDRFERQNASISINVFGYEKEIYPLRLSKYTRENVINLLLISEDEKQHYCLIKNMSRLLSSQTSNHNGSQLFCLRCLNSFNTQKALDSHKEYCDTNEAVKIELPEKGTKLFFKDFHKSMRVPFVVYADFESFTEQLDTCQQNPDMSYTKKYQKHTPSGFCYYIKCFDDSIYSQDPVIFTQKTANDDVAQMFVDTLEQNIREIYNNFDFSKKMIFTKDDLKAYEKATKCWICEGQLEGDSVRDHCHFSGKFRGAAHNKCNLRYRKPKFIPVIFHNLSGYDSHLFIRNLGKSEGNINCIPNNEEKYISFTKDVIIKTYTDKDGKKKKNVKQQLRFIDSFKFMASSLDSLVKNIQKHENLEKYYSGNVLLRKGVYPYDYMDSLAKLDDTSLPPKNAFYSKLNDSNISDDDYKHAQSVWNIFKMKSMRDYHDIYLKTDVLHLADVFENFRDVCLQNYILDPAWYYTAPGLAWDAALKITGVELELLSDPDMLLFIEKGIRGGISMISHRYGKANNKYMDYDKDKPTKHLTYLDANNLYGWAMNKPLPTHGFEWMNENELDSWKDHSCILEVDLEYPNELHDLHNDYPLAPESVTVNKVAKLIPNLNNKTKYIIHYENLKLYESLGMKIIKVHRGIKFQESPWLKKYIDLNTNLRSKATNDFEKDFFKLMNNSVFGKTMENIRNRVDIQLVNNEKKARKLAAKPNFKHCNIFDENLIAMHMKKTKLVFNKPVYLGLCILDLSKTLMYDFHYNYIKKKYGEKAKLLFTDTDSLAYEIETEDFYKDISNDVSKIFDTSNFPKDHPSGIETGVNKKVVGMFKDEAGGKIIDQFVGLRAKLYSYKMFEGVEEKKCKGVKRSVVKKNIDFEDYKRCLFDQKDQNRKMNVIRSYGHNLYTEEFLMFTQSLISYVHVLLCLPQDLVPGINPSIILQNTVLLAPLASCPKSAAFLLAMISFSLRVAHKYRLRFSFSKLINKSRCVNIVTIFRYNIHPQYSKKMNSHLLIFPEPTIQLA
ncbi:hypothetical protein GQR58_019518 [Nymphon striatum]|nr:hypothetical protein GQR58_019518 [Nymphon striatum]